MIIRNVESDQSNTSEVSTYLTNPIENKLSQWRFFDRSIEDYSF